MSEPDRLVLVQGITDTELRTLIQRWQGSPGMVLPAHCEVQIIDLRPPRIEPDIEDEP